MDHAVTLLPEFLLVILALALFASDRLAPRMASPLAILGLVGVLGVLIGQGLTGAVGGSAFHDAVQIGPFAWLMRGAILLAAAGAASLAGSPAHAGRFFGLLTASTVGAMLLAGASDLVILLEGLALMSLPLIGLLMLGSDRAKGEAAMKLFLVLGIAAGVLVLGSAWLFGLGGSTSFNALASALQTPDALLSFGLLILLGGLAFTVAAVPFHSWLPDVSQAASPALGAWLLGGAGLAALAGLTRILMMLFGPNAGLWAPYVTGLGVLSLLAGGFLALAQSDLRRMLGFLAIASTGVLLLALASASHAASSQDALGALVMTALSAAVAFVGLFAGLEALQARTLTDLNGLYRRAPWRSLALTVCALALASLPFTGAFWARLALVRAQLVYVSQSLHFGAIALAVFVMLMTVLGAYTLLRLPKALFLGPSAATEAPEAEAPAGPWAVLAVSAIMSVSFFVAPGALGALASFATRGF